MTRFQKQTAWGVLYLAIFSAAVVAWKIFAPSIFRFSFLSGWALFGMMLFLTLYNVRKKVPFLPLLTSEIWLQFHIYGGWLSFVLFAVHLGFRPPKGGFQIFLGALYLIVFLSGVVGLLLSRTLPRRLTTRGGEIIFERIPGVRRKLGEEAEILALETIPASGSSMVADFYARRLKNFFEEPPAYWSNVLGDRRALRELLNEMSNLNAFLSAPEREPLKKLTQLVEQKDGLDYHYATQLTLKLWLFVHIPFTYSLLVFTLAHILLVYSFTGRTP